MWFDDYTRTKARFEGKLLIEGSWDSAQLLIGDDIVTTYCGKEACRQTPDNKFVMTVPLRRGQRWLRLFGRRVDVHCSAHKPWKGGVESHMILHKGADLGGFRTTGLLCGHVKETAPYSWSPAEIHVPDSAIPRKKTLTDVGARQIEEEIEKFMNDITDSLVIKALKNGAQHHGYYNVKYRYGFERVFDTRSLERVQKDTTIDDIVEQARRRKFWIGEQINAECEYSKL